MSRISALEVSDCFAASRCYFFRDFQLAETVDGCQYDVLLVIGTKRLCTDILDAGKFAHGTCGASGDDAGTIGRLLQQDRRAAVFADVVMRDAGDFVERDADEVLGSIISALADRFRNFSCLAEAASDVAVAIA